MAATLFCSSLNVASINLFILLIGYNGQLMVLAVKFIIVCGPRIRLAHPCLSLNKVVECAAQNNSLIKAPHPTPYQTPL